MWSNFHSHSKYCDGKGELGEYVSAARKNKLFSVGFSSHAPVPFDCKWCMNADKLHSYLQEIDQLSKLNPDLEICKGLEVDFIPARVSPFQFKDVLDYTIGSIHFVDQFPDGRPWEIDNTQAVFEDGLREIFSSKAKDAIRRYFELTREMIYGAAPDIVGHIDKIKMQNIGEKYFSENDAWYRDEVLRTVKLIADANLIIEVNTRGIYQKKTTVPYPSPWILDKILEKKIRITMSSDAHHPDDIINQFPQTAALLGKLGFRHLAAFTDGAWKQIPFNENGFLR
ncbi:MAG TPA: histidinol-phosphatase [Chryseosolibacter sp.]|nr:histidinol-phosphatase [Chryseosolibacter sp.]